MVEQRYVRKRKRRKLAAFLSGVASIGICALIIVAFLGNHSGSFTVSLNKGNVKLSLSDKSNFNDGEGEGEIGTIGSYLRIDDLKAFDEMTFLKLPEDEILDTQDTTYTLGENSSQTLNFFKYTFFVKNMGSISADYNLTIRVLESLPSVNGTYLDSVIRVMFYANDGYNLDSHKYAVYAAPSEAPNIDEHGETTFSEYISLSPSQAQKSKIDFPGFAIPFESDSVIATIPVQYFDQSDMNRYTIVTWIEGYDPQSHGEAPEGACIKLGVEINAYENE